MKLAFFIKKHGLTDDDRVERILSELCDAGFDLYDVRAGLEEDTAMVVCFGGDGSFLSAASIVSDSGVPLAGINFGRVGFLSDINPDTAVQTIVSGAYRIEDRELLRFDAPALPDGVWPYAVNEVAVHRTGAGILGISVNLDGVPLPEYWADGLLISTSSGSTAYSLSAGGPVCSPGLPAFVISPVAPHNLNVRPLVIPSSCDVELVPFSRKDVAVMLSADNRNVLIPSGTPVRVSKAGFCLRKVKAADDDWISALRSKLFWGNDLRNSE